MAIGSSQARETSAALSGLDPALRQVSDDLVRLGHVTEQDFLLVGDQLQRVLAEAEQISAQCAELVGFLSGDEAGRGAQQLGSILDRARVMAEQAEGNRRALDEMLSGVSRISGPLAGLNSRMRTFRVMATLIRIEGARLRQAGVDFETLADDVRKLAADIEQNSTTVLSGSLELREIVREAAAGVGEFESRQKTELPRIQEQAADSLASLRARRDTASRASDAWEGDTTQCAAISESWSFRCNSTTSRGSRSSMLRRRCGKRSRTWLPAGKCLDRFASLSARNYSSPGDLF